MKANKTLIVVLSALMLTGCAEYLLPAKAVEKSIPDQIKEMLTPIINEGTFTKKSHIRINEATEKEIEKYFHAGNKILDMTTYYTPDALFMCNSNGVAATGDTVYHGGFKKDGDNKYTKFDYEPAAGVDFTVEDAFDATKHTTSWSEDIALWTKYTNLDNLLDDAMLTGFTSYADKCFEYTPASIEVNEDGTYKDTVLQFFQAFAAPMFRVIGSKYITVTKVQLLGGKLDARGEEYVSLKILVDEGDKGKTIDGSDVFVDTKVFKGNTIFVEDYSETFFIKSWDSDGVETSTKMALNPDNDKEMVVKGLELTAGSKFKAWSTKRGFEVGSTYGNNLTYAPQTTESGDYKIVYDGTYDIYVKFKANDLVEYDSTWVNMSEVRTIYCTRNFDWIENDSIKCYYWGKGISEPDFNNAVNMVFSHNNEYSQKVYKVVIPSETEKIIFRFKNNGDKQSVDITLNDDKNAYYFVNEWPDGKIKVESYVYIPE